mgnify:CR=1 FL=1
MEQVELVLLPSGAIGLAWRAQRWLAWYSPLPAVLPPLVPPLCSGSPINNCILDFWGSNRGAQGAGRYTGKRRGNWAATMPNKCVMGIARVGGGLVSSRGRKQGAVVAERILEAQEGGRGWQAARESSASAGGDGGRRRRTPPSGGAAGRVSCQSRASAGLDLQAIHALSWSQARQQPRGAYLGAGLPCSADKDGVWRRQQMSGRAVPPRRPTHA